MIFVFGSNLKGVHGAGAARHAYQTHGATWGYGEGRSGNSYALPTKLGPWGSMTLEDIQQRVINFWEYSTYHSELDFKITQIGCGRAGWKKEDIAPLFLVKEVFGHNCYFDTAWRKFLPKNTHFWGSH